MKKVLNLSEDSKRLGDLQYDAWMNGRDPDAVDPDKYDHYRSQGFYPEEISLNMMVPPRQREEPEDDTSNHY